MLREKPLFAEGAILLFEGGIILVPLGRHSKSAWTPLQNPSHIVPTMGKDRSNVASLDIMGGPVARLDCLWPLILRSVQLTISPTEFA